MKQFKIMALLFTALFIAVVSAKIYFDRLAKDLGGPTPAPEIHPEEPANPGTEEEGLIIEVE